MAVIQNLGLFADSAGGATAFTGLTDTPANYSGAGGKAVKVNVGASALEFVAVGGGNVTGPGSSVNNNFAVFNGTGGLTIQDGGKALAQITQLAFKTITFLGSGSQDPIVADGPADSMIFKAGTGITIESSAAQDEIEFSLSAGNAGDVDGPSGAVDDRIATFNGTTGKLLQDGGDKISDLTSRAFKTIKVAGQTDIVADGPSDDLTIAAGANISIATTVGTDTITITSSNPGGDVIGPSVAVDDRLVSFDGTTGDRIQDSGKKISDITIRAFKKVLVSGQNDITADGPADNLIFAAGANITLLTNNSTDTLTIAASHLGGDVVGPSAAVDDRVATFDTTTGKKIQDGGKTVAQIVADGAAAAPQGDVVGPGSAVDDRIATFDTTTGKLLQDGGKKVADLADAAFKTIAVSGQTSIVADAPADVLTVVAGTNVTLTTNATTDTLTINSAASGSSEWTDTGNILHPADGSGALESVVVGGTTKGNSDIVLDVSGAAVFNEQGAEVDFRVEALGTSMLIRTDGSNATLGISDNSTAPNQYNILDVISTTKASSPFPIMTASQVATAAGNMQVGSLAYNTTTNVLEMNQGGHVIGVVPNAPATIYVSEFGNDSLDGKSTSKPKKTMAAALVAYASASSPRKLVCLGNSEFETAVPLVVTKGGEIDLNGSWIKQTGTTAGQDLLRIDYDDVKGIWVHGGLLWNQYGPCLTVKKAYEPIIRDIYFYQPSFVQINLSTDATGGSNRTSVVALNCSSNAASSRVSGILRDCTIMRQWGTVTVSSSPGVYASMIRQDSNGKGDSYTDVKFNDWIIDGNVIYETCAGSGFDTNTGGLVLAGIRICEQGTDGTANGYGLNNMPTCYSHNNQYTIDMNPRGNTSFTGSSRMTMFAALDRYASSPADNTMKMKLVSSGDIFRCEWSTKTTNSAEAVTPRLNAFYQWGDARSHSKNDCRWSFNNMTVDTGLGRLDDTTSDGSLAINCGAFSTERNAWIFWAGDGGANLNVSLSNCHWTGTAREGQIAIREIIGTPSMDERVNIWCSNVSDDFPSSITGLNDCDTGNSATHQISPITTFNAVNVAGTLTTAKMDGAGTDVSHYNDFRMADGNHNNPATTGGTLYANTFNSGFGGPMVFTGSGSFDTISLPEAQSKIALSGQYGAIELTGSNSQLGMVGTGSAALFHTLVHNGDCRHYGANYSRHQMTIGTQHIWSGNGTVSSYGSAVKHDGEYTSNVYGVRRTTYWTDGLTYVGCCWNGYTNSAGSQDGTVIKWGMTPHMVEGTIDQREGLEATGNTNGNYISDGTADRWTIAVALWGKVSSSTALLECQIGPWVEIY